MNNEFSKIVSELRNQESQLDSQVEKLKSQVNQAESRLQQIRQAVQLLEGETRPLKQNTRTKHTRPSATKQDVIRAISECLKSTPTIPLEQLRKLAEQKIGEQGKTRMGFKLRFKEALKDPRFQFPQDDIVSMS